MPKPRPMLDLPSQARLGEKLRTIYEGVIEEPVPEHLQRLVGALADLGLDVHLDANAQPGHAATEPTSLSDYRAATRRQPALAHPRENVDSVPTRAFRRVAGLN